MGQTIQAGIIITIVDKSELLFVLARLQGEYNLWICWTCRVLYCAKTAWRKMV